MALKSFNPTSPGRRFMTVLTFDEITKSKPEKALTEPRKRTGGRDNRGRITMRFIGGGHKQRYRIIDFKRRLDNVEATVLQVEYDPNRSARIALLQYADEAKTKAYILSPDGLKAGDKVMSGETDAVEPRPGNCMPMWKIPLGMQIHNVEIMPGKGGQICRSAGCAATLSAREKDWAQLTMPSGTFHSGMQLPGLGSTASVSPEITLSPALRPSGARM